LSKNVCIANPECSWKGSADVCIVRDSFYDTTSTTTTTTTIPTTTTTTTTTLGCSQFTKKSHCIATGDAFDCRWKGSLNECRDSANFLVVTDAPLAVGEVVRVVQNVCGKNYRVVGHVCTACLAGTTNDAGDYPRGDDTQCDEPISASDASNSRIGSASVIEPVVRIDSADAPPTTGVPAVRSSTEARRTIDVTAASSGLVGGAAPSSSAKHALVAVTTDGKGSDTSIGAIAGAAVGAVVLLLVVLGIIVYSKQAAISGAATAVGADTSFQWDAKDAESMLSPATP
jgi:hypothetical protein